MLEYCFLTFFFMFANQWHSYVPAATAFSHILAVGYLTTLAVRTIHRSYLTLPPSSATRFREPLRKGHVQIFSILALVSLAVAFFYGVTFSDLSYRVWATERGFEVPERYVIPICLP